LGAGGAGGGAGHIPVIEAIQEIQVNWHIALAFWSGLIAVVTTWLIPFAYFGDQNETWTRRLSIIAFVSAMIFLFAILYERTQITGFRFPID
jgi:preprotein translocase subunit SecY